MNWLDRSIAAVSPRWAYKRLAWRSGMEVFDAGSRGRINHNWNPSQSPNEHMKATERSLIRARAQDMERNSDIGGAILSAFDRNVVGTGITLQSKVSHDLPGNIEGEFNRQIERLWKEFCKAENVDITGTQSLEEIEDMSIRRYIVDGGIFLVKVYVKNTKFPFKIQVRSVDELDTKNTIVTPSQGNRIVEGVEIDQHNKPVAYHFKKVDGYLLNSVETVKIPAKDVIFLYKKTSPQQVREVSNLATALPRVKDANQFVEAVSIKERVLACLSVFIKKDVPSGGAGRGVRTSSETIDYSGVSLAPGMIGELNPGDEVQTVVPSGQASNAKEWITTLVRLTSAGIGLSYEAVSRDLSQVNYSSARQGLIEDRKLYKKLQKMLIERVLTPIYLEFLDAMVLTGQLNLPKYQQNKEQYTTHAWIPPGSTWIDPLKEVKANETALASNQDTLARICAERGEDWRDVVAQRAAEQQLIRELSDPEPTATDIPKEGADNEPDEENKDAEDADDAA
ncbi:phage portal protein [Paenibacillus polymyxa]|uniref:phage portal protein n=1 Tax=Paenibacillus polymyxa TaxID=1406 RepID=UPI002AB57515|nr:phage portal protein [Paenibacillus polymyxa]MDY7990678.1 phage portal protein [Paenibacillus polymyxa]MDY8117511.1 phage portal protein [Paenibacillus polymyxa]